MKESHLRKAQDVTGFWCLITGSSLLCRGLTLPLLQGRPLTSSLHDFHSARGKPRLTTICSQLQLRMALSYSYTAQMQRYRRASTPVKTNMPDTHVRWVKPKESSVKQHNKFFYETFKPAHQIRSIYSSQMLSLTLPLPVRGVLWAVVYHQVIFSWMRTLRNVR